METQTVTTADNTAQIDPSVAIGIAAVAIIFYAIPNIIIMWRAYQRAGKPGWASIIPFYSTFVMAEIAKKPQSWAIALVALNLLSSIPVVGLLFVIPALVLGIILFVRFAQTYNKDLVFWLLAIFLPFIAVFMSKDLQYKSGADTVHGYMGGAEPAYPKVPSTPAAPAAPVASTPPTEQASGTQESNQTNPTTGAGNSNGQL